MTTYSKETCKILTKTTFTWRVTYQFFGLCCILAFLLTYRVRAVKAQYTNNASYKCRTTFDCNATNRNLYNGIEDCPPSGEICLQIYGLQRIVANGNRDSESADENHSKCGEFYGPNLAGFGCQSYVGGCGGVAAFHGDATCPT